MKTWHALQAARGLAIMMMSAALCCACGVALADGPDPASARADEEAAVMRLQQLAQQGNAKAQFDLGKLFAEGKGTAKDETQAAAWFRKSAEQGYARAQVNLGLLYEHGRGVTKDEAQAVAWYREAAEQGQPAGQHNLGVMYATGRGIAKDDAQALVWYHKAAEQGHVPSQNNLGLMYETGQGVAQDEAQAAAWYRKAAEQGHAAAARRLSLMYETGRGVAKDETQAATWQRTAVEHGYFDPYAGPNSIIVMNRPDLAPTPALAIYDDGQAIFLKRDGARPPAYLRAMLSAAQLAAVKSEIVKRIGDTRVKAGYDVAPGWDGEPFTHIYIHFDNTHFVTNVHGVIGVARMGFRLGTVNTGNVLINDARIPMTPDSLPDAVIELHRYLAELSAADAQPWKPRYVEITLAPAFKAIVPATPWPETWPTLDSTMVQRRGDGYAVFLPAEKDAEVAAFLPGFKLVELAGQKWRATYRYAFPGARKFPWWSF